MPSSEVSEEPDEPPEAEDLPFEEDDDDNEGEGDDIVADGSSDDGQFVELDPSGRYGRYAEVLGRGAMKTVYRAYDMTDCKEVAWNRARPPVECSDEQAFAVQREVHILRRLKDHQGILKLYSAWLDELSGDINFITELCSTTLLDFRLKHKHISRKALKNWGRQILMGLAHLHTRDPPIIHRDLKCENILVKCRSNTALKIGDFGSATFLDETHHMHTLVGTPEFMAPEMFQEDYNELVDIYSFGMCMIELLTRECPYSECKSLGQIYKKVMKGEKPKALHKVTDMQALTFINRCLLPASTRPSAIELLADPFLKRYKQREGPDQNLKASISMPNLTASTNNILMKSMLGEQTVDSKTTMLFGDSVGSDPRSKVSADRSNIETKGSARQKVFCTKSPSFRRSYRVTGRIEDQYTLRLKIRIQESSRSCDIDFPFDLRFDSPRSVAEEMVRTLDYSESDLVTITDLIREEIAALIPDMKGRSTTQSPGMNVEDSDESDLSASTISSSSWEHSVTKNVIISDESSDKPIGYDDHDIAGCKACRKAVGMNSNAKSPTIPADGHNPDALFTGEVDYIIDSNGLIEKILENKGMGTSRVEQANSVTDGDSSRLVLDQCNTEQAVLGSNKINTSGFLDGSALSSPTSWTGCQTSGNDGHPALIGAIADDEHNTVSNDCGTFTINNRLVLFGSRPSSLHGSSSRFKHPPIGIGILLRPSTEQGLRRGYSLHE